MDVPTESRLAVVDASPPGEGVVTGPTDAVRRVPRLLRVVTREEVVKGLLLTILPKQRTAQKGPEKGPLRP